MSMPARSLVAAVSISLLLTAAAVQADHLRNVEIGQTVPPFSLATLDGQQIDSDSLAGSVVILIVVSAEQHSSELAAAEAHQVVQNLHHDDLKLIFTTADIARGEYFRQQRDVAGVHEPLALDHDRKLYGDLGVIVLPTTVLIDRAGKLAHVISGHKSDYPHVLDAYAQHTLGLVDDEGLEKLLATTRFEHDRPSDRAARHQAAARILRERGLLQDAEVQLLSGLELDPGNADLLLDLAALQLANQQIDAAAQTVARVLEAHPEHRQAQLMHGIVLFHQGKLDEAEAVLTRILILNPDPARTHYYLGKIAEQKGDKDQALTHYREALERLLG